MDYSKIDKIELEGVDLRDYPDFSDAYISSAIYEGKEMNQEQLEKLNSNADFVYDAVLSSVF